MNDASIDHAIGAFFGLHIHGDSRVLVAAVRPDNESALEHLREHCVIISVCDVLSVEPIMMRARRSALIAWLH